MLSPLLPYTPDRDVYRLLGVRASASAEEINAACRRLARTFHPDRNPSARATAEMQVVNTVRRVLTDPETRALYDRERLRFHAMRGQGASVRARPPMPPAQAAIAALPAPPTPIQRYARATVAGVLTTIRELLPARCGDCYAVALDAADAYCVVCGSALRRSA